MIDPLAALPPLVLDLFTRRHARRAELLPGGPRALEALLRARGFVPHAAVLAFDEAFGGLELPEQDGLGPDWQASTERSWIFGAGACLTCGAHGSEAGQRPDGGEVGRAHALVPIGYDPPHDTIYYLDAAGNAWVEDTIEGPGVALFARSGSIALGRILLGRVAFERHLAGRLSTLAGHRGAETAARLGLPALDLVSDELERWWGDAATLVFEAADFSSSYLTGERPEARRRTIVATELPALDALVASLGAQRGWGDQDETGSP